MPFVNKSNGSKMTSVVLVIITFASIRAIEIQVIVDFASPYMIM